MANIVDKVKDVDSVTRSINDARIGGGQESAMIRITIEKTNYLVIRKMSDTTKVTVIKLS